MKLHVKEIETQQGRVVQIPLNEWQQYSRQYEQMKLQIVWKQRLKSSLNQVKKMEAGKIAAKSIEDFLNV